MDKSLHILVVDDEPAIRQVLVSTLNKAGYGSELARDGNEALQRLSQGDVDVAICDIKMPGIDGIELVQRCKQMGIETLFIMMTAFASVDTAIQAMKAGAYDYFVKPLRKEVLLLRLGQIADMIGLKEQNRALRNLVQEGVDKGKCRLVSSAMLDNERLLRKVAPTDYTVLITGESGTGKGVLARQVHETSPRKEGLFIPVNCGSIPEKLMESEFFGHIKGAFTGADRANKGLFLEADKGTLFLDEIGELPLHLQVKLLHVIEEKKVRPVGGNQFKSVDVRIITATNRNLEQMVAEGTFREDLFFRLNVFNIHIPPLRERREDIPILARYFLERHAQRRNDGIAYRLDGETETALTAHDWPGNVRELENMLERAMILAENGVITVDDLPRALSGLAVAARGETEGAAARGEDLRSKLRDYEIRVILETIEESGGDRRLAARRLGIGVSSLYRKLEQANLPRALE